MATRKTKSPVKKGGVSGKRFEIGSSTPASRAVTSSDILQASPASRRISNIQHRGGVRFGTVGVIGTDNPKLIFDSREGLTLKDAFIQNNTGGSLTTQFLITSASLEDAENNLKLRGLEVNPANLWSAFKSFPSHLQPLYTTNANAANSLSANTSFVFYMGIQNGGLPPSTDNPYYVYAMSSSSKLPYAIILKDEEVTNMA